MENYEDDYWIGPVYHGTNTKFNNFEINRKGKRSIFLFDYETISSGIFFSINKKDAESYGEHIVTCHINIYNQLTDQYSELFPYIFEPMIHEENGKRYIDIGLTSMEVKDYPNERYEEDKHPWIYKLYNLENETIKWDCLDNPEVVKRMKEKGFGCVKVDEPDDTSGYSWFIMNLDDIRIDRIEENRKKIIKENMEDNTYTLLDKIIRTFQNSNYKLLGKNSGSFSLALAYILKDDGIEKDNIEIGIITNADEEYDLFEDYNNPMIYHVFIGLDKYCIDGEGIHTNVNKIVDWVETEYNDFNPKVYYFDYNDIENKSLPELFKNRLECDTTTAEFLDYYQRH